MAWKYDVSRRYAQEPGEPCLCGYSIYVLGNADYAHSRYRKACARVARDDPGNEHGRDYPGAAAPGGRPSMGASLARHIGEACSYAVSRYEIRADDAQQK